MRKERVKVMASRNYEEWAGKIIELVGGADNLTNITHCATRLRLNVKDDSAVDTEKLGKLDGVLGLENRNGQVQVIVGQIVEDLYNATAKQLEGKVKLGGEVEAGPGEHKTILERFAGFLLMMSSVLSPVIPALIAAGFITCLLLGQYRQKVFCLYIRMLETF